MAPLREDLAFIGQIRKCAECRQSSQMFWIPDQWWRRVPEAKRRQHLCFDCFLLYSEEYCEAVLEAAVSRSYSHSTSF